MIKLKDALAMEGSAKNAAAVGIPEEISIAADALQSLCEKNGLSHVNFVWAEPKGAVECALMITSHAKLKDDMLHALATSVINCSKVPRPLQQFVADSVVEAVDKAIAPDAAVHAMMRATIEKDDVEHLHTMLDEMFSSLKDKVH